MMVTRCSETNVNRSQIANRLLTWPMYQATSDGRLQERCENLFVAVATRCPMSAVLDRVIYLDEVADLLATRPTRDEILAFRPSEEVETRFAELIAKQRAEGLSDDEQEELEQFQQTEMLLRLLKARLRQG